MVISTVAVVTRNALCLTTESLQCASVSYAPNQCSLTSERTAVSIEKTQQLSTSPCDLGVTYGLTSDLAAVWVTGGCRAIFRVTFSEGQSLERVSILKGNNKK